MEHTAKFCPECSFPMPGPSSVLDIDQGTPAAESNPSAPSFDVQTEVHQTHTNAILYHLHGHVECLLNYFNIFVKM